VTTAVKTSNLVPKNISTIKMMRVKIFIASFVYLCYLINCRDYLVLSEITRVVRRKGKTIAKEAFMEEVM
jgi:hypothetical protein